VQELVRDDHEAWMACMVARGEKMQIIMQAHAPPWTSSLHWPT
jgi:hypothetical protein